MAVDLLLTFLSNSLIYGNSNCAIPVIYVLSMDTAFGGGGGSGVVLAVHMTYKWHWLHWKKAICCQEQGALSRRGLF